MPKDGSIEEWQEEDVSNPIQRKHEARKTAKRDELKQELYVEEALQVTEEVQIKAK